MGRKGVTLSAVPLGGDRSSEEEGTHAHSKGSSRSVCVCFLRSVVEECLCAYMPCFTVPGDKKQVNTRAVFVCASPKTTSLLSKRPCWTEHTCRFKPGSTTLATERKGSEIKRESRKSYLFYSFYGRSTLGCWSYFKHDLLLLLFCARIRTHYLDLMIRPKYLRGTFIISPTTVTWILGFVLQCDCNRFER